MKYYAEITGWGDEAKAFLKELNYIILFNDNAPSELAEISILHSIGEMKGAPWPGRWTRRWRS